MYWTDDGIATNAFTSDWSVGLDVITVIAIYSDGYRWMTTGRCLFMLTMRLTILFGLILVGLLCYHCVDGFSFRRSARTRARSHIKPRRPQISSALRHPFLHRHRAKLPPRPHPIIGKVSGNVKIRSPHIRTGKVVRKGGIKRISSGFLRGGRNVVKFPPRPLPIIHRRSGAVKIKPHHTRTRTLVRKGGGSRITPHFRVGKPIIKGGFVHKTGGSRITPHFRVGKPIIKGGFVHKTGGIRIKPHFRVGKPIIKGGFVHKTGSIRRKPLIRLGKPLIRGGFLGGIRTKPHVKLGKPFIKGNVVAKTGGIRIKPHIRLGKPFIRGGFTGKTGGIRIKPHFRLGRPIIKGGFVHKTGIKIPKVRIPKFKIPKFKIPKFLPTFKGGFKGGDRVKLGKPLIRGGLIHKTDIKRLPIKVPKFKFPFGLPSPPHHRDGFKLNRNKHFFFGGIHKGRDHFKIKKGKHFFLGGIRNGRDGFKIKKGKHFFFGRIHKGRGIFKKRFHGLPIKLRLFWGRFSGHRTKDDEANWDHDTCQCTGDPHCTSLDGKRFDYQGTCEYRMFKTPPGFEPSVEIDTKLDHVGSNKRVAYNRIVTVKVGKYSIIINGIEQYVKTCEGNTELDDCHGVVDDYFIEEHNVTIEKEGTSRWRSRISVNIEKAGIKVKFYQWKNLIIDISTKYKNNPKLSEPDYEGFCGNYNGNKVDDGENLDRLAQHALISGRYSDKDCMKSANIDTVKVTKKNKRTCKKIFKQDLPKVLKNLLPIPYQTYVLSLALKGYRCKVNMEDIDMQIKNCAIDMTLSASNDRCQVLANQLSDCVVSWREELGCPMKCPANSRYIFNKPKFVSSCVMPVALNASLVEGEGCLCKKGYLQSNDECVKPKECGCFTKGNYRQNGDKWIQRVRVTENGKSVFKIYRYECNGMKPRRIKLECKFSEKCFFKQPSKEFMCCPANGCSHIKGSGCGEIVELGEWEIQTNDGFYDPVDFSELATEVEEVESEVSSPDVEGNSKSDDSSSSSSSSSDNSDDDVSDEDEDSNEGHDTCECAGDPHCITLDGKKFDYQGTCEYRMFKTPSDSALDVEIKTKLGHRGRNKDVSFNRVVTITIGKYHVILNGTGEFMKTCEGDVESDDCDGIVDSYDIEEHDVTVKREGRKWRKSRITVNIKKVGITVYFNRWKNLIIEVPRSFRNNADLNRPDIQGFCGNYNGDSSDDVVDVNALAENSRTSGDKDCMSSTTVDDVKVDPKAEQICTKIFREDLPMILKYRIKGYKCRLNIRRKSKLIHNCAVDMTLTGDFDRCQILENELSNCIVSWRDRMNCPMKCPAHSKYIFNKPRHVPTCVKPNPRKRRKIQGEGCLCDAGYLESNDKCVKPDDCGCLIHGQYRQPGETWIQRVRIRSKRIRRTVYYRYRCEKSGPRRIKLQCEHPNKCFFKQPEKVYKCCPSGGCHRYHHDEKTVCGGMIEIGLWEIQTNDGGYVQVTTTEPATTTTTTTTPMTTTPMTTTPMTTTPMTTTPMTTTPMPSSTTTDGIYEEKMVDMPTTPADATTPDGIYEEKMVDMPTTPADATTPDGISEESLLEESPTPLPIIPVPSITDDRIFEERYMLDTQPLEPTTSAEGIFEESVLLEPTPDMFRPSSEPVPTTLEPVRDHAFLNSEPEPIPDHTILVSDQEPIADEMAPTDEGGEPEGAEPEGSEPEGNQQDNEEPEDREQVGGQPEGEEPESEEPDNENNGKPNEEEGEPESGEPEGEEPDGDEQEAHQPEGGEPEGEEPEGDQPEGDEPEGEEPEGDQPEGEEPEDEEPDKENNGEPNEIGDEPEGGEPEGEEPEGEEPQGEEPEGEEPEGEEPEGEEPEGEGPEGEEPEGNEPEGEEQNNEPQSSEPVVTGITESPTKPKDIAKATTRAVPDTIGMKNIDPEGEKADAEYYKLTLKTDYYKIKPHDITRGVVKQSGVTATTFLPQYPPNYAISTIKYGPGWSPDLSVKQRQCLTIDLGHLVSVHGWMTTGARMSDGTSGYVYVGNNDAVSPKFHCEHRYRGTPMSIRYFRLCLIDGEYSKVPLLRIIILGFRDPRDPAMLLGLLNDRYTLSLVGCPCYFDTSSKYCACCQPGASQCGPSSPSQCVLSGFPKMCGTVHPRLPTDVSFSGQKLDLPVEKVPTDHPFKEYITEICPPGYQICSLKPFICKNSGELRCPGIRKQPAHLISTEADYLMSGTPLSHIPEDVLNLAAGPDEEDTNNRPEGEEPEGNNCICP
ncbi:hypothetical protein LSH36_325g02108 [Paralvinella palmiformis]|uniref:VWFD domain-containing protein n=1 Tax=Paralvinella palmiformis TaxID=53620 RepID=A0AAD9JH37_9ANNE|nr:hypothetical protein LSH36_325g02108 [Paralvinella palmiformis]